MLPRTPIQTRSSEAKQQKADNSDRVKHSDSEPSDQESDSLRAVVEPISNQKKKQKKKAQKAKMEEQLRVLKQKRDAVQKKVRRVRMALVEPDNPNLNNKHYLQMHLDMVKRCYTEYNDFQNQIYDLNIGEDRQTQEELIFVDFEQQYGDIVIRLTTMIEDAIKSETPAVSPTSLQVHPPNQTYQQNLPPLRVPLPTFDGAYENWYAFRSMFENIMERYQSESPAIKLYQLRNALVGKASGIIDQDIINNNDYEAAWKTLRDRFEDKRLIVGKHIEAILNLPKLCKESAVELRRLIDTCTKNVDALTNLKLPVAGLGEMMLLNVLSSKMDFETRKAWELMQKPGELPRYNITINFLKERCKAFEKILISTKSIGESARQVRPTVKADTKTHSLVTTVSQCVYCEASHPVWQCDPFKAAGIKSQRESLVKSKACFNCLQRGHRASKCKSAHTCRKCGERHHTLLHQDEQLASESTLPASAAQSKNANQAAPLASPSSVSTDSSLCTLAEVGQKQSLIATAMVYVHGTGQSKHPCRVVLDSASHSHFVTEQFATLLGLKRKPAYHVISGINGQQVPIKFKLHAQVESRVSDYTTDALEFLIIPRITGDLPLKRLNAYTMGIPSGIALADPAFHVPDTIDLLIGSEIFFKLLKTGKIDLGSPGPTLQETHFGWIVSGLVPKTHTTIGSNLCSTTEEEDLNQILARFYEVESCQEIAKNREAEEELCLTHFSNTYERSPDGRYVVRIPFNAMKDKLGDSRRMAEKRFLALERRLDREPELKDQYKEFIREYEDLRHLREIVPAPDEEPASAFYLPHHCVLKPTSSTTKLRVVYDGSAESSTGISINEVQYAGPSMQNDLISILLNFRSFRYAISADIPKMYRQVVVHPEDQPYQRILWRDDSSQPLRVFQLTTVTYGLKSSPFLATMALIQLAEDEGSTFPLAGHALRKSCYIDDMLCGADSIPEIFELKQQLFTLLGKGGFSVHKLCSNSEELLSQIPTNQRESSLEIDNPNINVLMKTLGIAWEPKEDTFKICIPQPSDVVLTKRRILSEIAKIFDPLGFLGPVITTAKLFMRELWMLEAKWDDPVPPDIEHRWKLFRDEFTFLNDTRIPRCFIANRAVAIQLHGFADASDQACGACVYARSVFPNGSAEMTLICSKSKILPKTKRGKPKQISTPRAELEAALLLAILVNKTINAVDRRFDSTVLWSDSQIVLAWITKHPENLLVFVANRVRKIQKFTKVSDWRYIPSKLNPADLISRGDTPKQFINRELWWKGPPSLSEASYHIESPIPVTEEDLPELKSTSLINATIAAPRVEIFDRISRFPIIQRAMAYVIRFTDFIRIGRKVITKGLPTVDEMKRALHLIVRLVQAETFQAELKQLEKNPSYSHPLRCLSPFIDSKDGILRVGGRIKHAIIPYDSKHQMLLPESHPVTTAIIRHLHRSNLHIGQRGLLAIVRQRFWPLRVKGVIRKVIHQCIPCFRTRPTRATQLMGDLPDYRVQPAPVFSTTGVDFAGPFTIKSLTQSKKPFYTKGYVSVFVCMATRAVHLEAVSNLTTDAFLAALQRFASRRGLPSKMVSDNATNFEGACNELNRLAALFKDEQLQRKLNDFCSKGSIEWSFIPPRSPHFGGIWEAGVKSVKFHLMLILAEHKLTFEELTTVLAQIEAILNSRPLIPSSDDPNDLTAITPAHFIIGREFQAIPEPSYDHIPIGRLSRWQFLQDLKQKFWNIWMTDYLQELQRRQKDYKVTKFKVGSLVLIVDENHPPLQWSLARITELHPGNDGHTRVVTLRTKDGITKRVVKKVCILPLDDETH